MKKLNCGEIVKLIAPKRRDETSSNVPVTRVKKRDEMA
jgi:hypothetical protein